MPSNSKLNPFILPVVARLALTAILASVRLSANSGAVNVPADSKIASMALWMRIRGGISPVLKPISISGLVRLRLGFLGGPSGVDTGGFHSVSP
jgi:hypothetical protein